VIAARNDARRSKLATELNISSVHVDADQPGTIEQGIKQVAQEYGSLTNVVNCIGSILLKPAHQTKLSEFEDVLRTNLYSSFEVIRGAASTMRKSGGSVVLISTAAAKVGLPNHEAIAAAKAGLEGLALSAAATYARYGLRINVVSPGLVKSEMSKQIWENESFLEASRSMHALGRIGKPEDVASMLAWLVDPANDWVTGQVFGVDGGLSSIMLRQKV
jgi:NAD(P)-dependent dehydrogenase (short-subunit alcohol dehydrogenase family)